MVIPMHRSARFWTLATVMADELRKLAALAILMAALTTALFTFGAPVEAAHFKPSSAQID